VDFSVFLRKKFYVVALSGALYIVGLALCLASYYYVTEMVGLAGCFDQKCYFSGLDDLAKSVTFLVWMIWTKAINNRLRHKRGYKTIK